LLAVFVALNAFMVTEEELEWLWAIVATLCSRMLGRSEAGHGRRATPILLKPVQFEELSRASSKRALVRGVVSAPLLVAFGMLMTVPRGGAAWSAALSFLILAGIVVTTEPLLDCLKLSQQSNDTKRISMWVFWLGGGGAFAVVALLALLYPDPNLRYLALLGCAVISGGMWQVYRSAYNRGAFDMFVDVPLSQQIDRRR
jgi:hypothetical protein